MGAFTHLHLLDHDALVEVFEASKALLASGHISIVLQQYIERARTMFEASEQRFAKHYTGKRRPSDELTRLCQGLEVEAGPCESLEADLRVRDALLLTLQPSIDGACAAQQCPHRGRRPLHPEGQSLVSNELLLELLQRTIRAQSLSESVSLGRAAIWLFVEDWFWMELGDDAHAATTNFAEAAPLVQMLLRLFKRGAVIGWADGGSGEGILGWLAPDECGDFADALRSHPHASALVCAGFEDPHNATSHLPQMREVMEKVLRQADEAVRRGKGLLLTRD
jgi:hypothetical protein